MPQTHSLITIMIPTKDRPDFLDRILRYYTDTRFQHEIFIGDASGPAFFDKNAGIIERYHSQVHIRRFACQGLTVARSLKLMNAYAQTPYATFIADDDFIVTESIQACIEFLEKNKDYTGAHGTGVVFTLDLDGAFGKINGAGDYWMGELKQESAKNRLSGLFDKYFVPLFSIHRVKVWKKMWEHAGPMDNVSIEGELLPCALAAVEGKIKKLRCLYLIRQDHDKRFHPDRFDWMTMPTWLPSYQLAHECLSESLAKKDNMTIDEAREIAKKVFWRYLSRALTIQYNERYGKKGRSKNFKRALHRIPFVGKPYRSLRIIKDRILPGVKVSLAALTSRSSLYYKDFRPVHEAIGQK